MRIRTDSARSPQARRHSSIHVNYGLQIGCGGPSVQAIFMCLIIWCPGDVRLECLRGTFEGYHISWSSGPRERQVTCFQSKRRMSVGGVFGGEEEGEEGEGLAREGGKRGRGSLFVAYLPLTCCPQPW